ncbi:MAG TPA: ClpX C4-type zinc finger protein [Streptosporangiaceae bacterium]|nr:ClpX C4-type zinc finger protein [Streptosporangiaceae bacterium]
MKPIGEDQDDPRFKCSFCGKRRHQVSGVAVAAGVSVCTECLALCHEIITEELA